VSSGEFTTKGGARHENAQAIHAPLDAFSSSAEAAETPVANGTKQHELLGLIVRSRSFDFSGLIQ